MGIYMRVNSVEQLEGIEAMKKEKSMIERIQDSERVGYAYFYPSDGGKRQEFYISTTPENLANFLLVKHAWFNPFKKVTIRKIFIFNKLF